LLAVAVALLLLGPLSIPTTVVRAGGPYTVTVSNDGPDSNLADGICYDGVNGCTLRAAIEQASYDGVATTITFDTSLAGITHYLSDAYGSLYVSGNDIFINGYIGLGYSLPLINGSNLTGSKNVFEIQGNYNTLRALVVRDGPANGIRIYDPFDSGSASHNTLDNLIVYGNGNNGIAVLGNSSGGGHENIIVFSLIGGANWMQTTCPGDGNGWDGILIAGGADNTNINSNEIVCNGNSGIYLYWQSGMLVSGTLIQNNKIGTYGTEDLGNGLSGIADWQASGTTIYNNTISGNGNDGVWLNGSTDATLTANRIGVNHSGDMALPNGDPAGYSGVTISDGAHDNLLGSPTDANARNIISGNAGCGVEIVSGAYSNELDGNYIGLGGTDGMVNIPNGLAGVCITEAGSYNALSYGTATAIQFISGNTREGVYVRNTNSVYINPPTYIGVAGNGSTPAGNQLEGIKLDEGTTNSIMSAGKVMYNGSTGIAVVGDTSIGNYLGSWTVKANVGLPIDLGNDGHTANGTHSPPGPNNWMNYPEVTSLISGSFSGTTCPGCVVRIYQVSGDPTAGYGGGDLLTQINANAVTGAFDYTFLVGVSTVTMVACNQTTYDCSEMSPSVVDPGTPSYNLYLPGVIQ